MEKAPQTLPDEVEALHAALAAAQSRVRELEAKAGRAQDLEQQVSSLIKGNAELHKHNTYLATLNAKLEAQVARLQRLKFGALSEKLSPEQLQLAFEDIEQTIAELKAEREKASPAEKKKATDKRRETRPSLPDDLPEVEVVIEPEAKACPCCAGGLHRIGEDSSRRLDRVPAQYRVLITRRPKYACRACEDVVIQAPAPARLIEGGLPTEALVADVVVKKYADHVPIYRQIQGMAREGLVLHRSVLTSWVGRSALELRPIVFQMSKELFERERLFVDETVIPVLDPGRGRTRTGYFWGIASDDRGWGGTAPPGVVFTYAPGRGKSHAAKLLKDFVGVVQCDGYGVYKSLAADRGNALALAHCWAHARRELLDLDKSGPGPIASEALRRISQFYAIEAEIRGCPPHERLAARQARTRPLVQAMELWLAEKLDEIYGGSELAKRLRYIQNHWAGLTRFLDDGRIELDNNAIERAMRPIALNRKNSLFAGSDSGAEHWAVMASIIESCKLNGVNPQAYMTDVLTRLVNLWPNSRISELTPWAWKAGAV